MKIFISLPIIVAGFCISLISNWTFFLSVPLTLFGLYIASSATRFILKVPLVSLLGFGMYGFGMYHSPNGNPLLDFLLVLVGGIMGMGAIRHD